MNKYLKCGAIPVILFALYGCDSGSDNPAKIDQEVQTPPAVEMEEIDGIGSANEAVNEALEEAAKEEKEKAEVVMADFEEKLKASTQDMSEEDQAAAMELLEEFQQKLEAQEAVPEAP